MNPLLLIIRVLILVVFNFLVSPPLVSSPQLEC